MHFSVIIFSGVIKVTHTHTPIPHSLVNDTNLEAFIVTDFGKKFMKSVNLSPDGFLQLTFQLAYYK